MATKLSDSGLLFISSWSLYSETIYKTDSEFGSLQDCLGFYDANMLSSFSDLNDDFTAPKTITKENALSCLRSYLNKVVLNLLTDFGFEKFNQNQFDSLVSLLSVNSKISDFYVDFKNSTLYSALKNDSSNPDIFSLICNYNFPDKLLAVKNMYNSTDRRLAEAEMYTSGLYNNCSNLFFKEEIVDGVKVFYSASS